MGRNSRGDKEIIGSRPTAPGEDPRFDSPSLMLVDNGATMDIEDDDQFDSVDVDDDPNLVWATDEDGVRGFRPYVEASQKFPTSDQVENDDESELDGQNRTDAAENEPLGDEFEERMKQREEAATDVHGEPVSDITQLAAVQQAQTDEATDAAPFARINPPSSADALLGGIATLKVGSPNQEVARWTAESQIESCPVTVTFGEASQALAPSQRIFVPNVPGLRPFGIVQFGTRNAAIFLEVDIGTGVQFTIGASAVNLQVGLENSLAANSVGGLTLAGQLSFYPVVRSQKITRTRYFDTDGVTVTADFSVPNFAKDVTIIVPFAAAASQIVSFLNSNEKSVYEVELAANTITTIPLSGEVFTVQVINSDVSVLTSFSAIFGLAL